jgi:hypothetical protein
MAGLQNWDFSEGLVMDLRLEIGARIRGLA